MSQRVMPFIFLNMTGEMAYILEQRLIAQKVTELRCQQVLIDILKFVFNKDFLLKLFKPQEEYTRLSVRQYFEEIAHSSVMRLNKPSMDRLFDMLSMAVKQQVMLIIEPSHLIYITINHLKGIHQIASFSADLINNVKYAHELLINTYKDTPVWEMALIRCTLLNHFQNLHIRVSKLMRLGVQMDNGRFRLQTSPIQIPNGAVPPGSIRYFENGQISRTVTFAVEDEFVVNANKGTFDLMDIDNRCTTFGDNMFCDDHQTELDSKRRSNNIQKKTASGADEMKLLSQLINRFEPASTQDNFILDIFGDEDDFDALTAQHKASSKTSESKQLHSKSCKQKTDDTTKVCIKKKSLTSAMQEMDIKSANFATSDQQFSTVGMATRKSRGEKLLKMMDEEVATIEKKVTATREPRSQSNSTKVIRNRSAIKQKHEI